MVYQEMEEEKTTEICDVGMMDFQTPEIICEYMISLLGDGVYKNILEPTPGEGNLVRAIKKKFPESEVIEPMDFYKEILTTYDAILMNPPFSPPKQAYSILDYCMSKSNRIIALMPHVTIINSSKRTKRIFDFGVISIIHLPRKIFQGSRVQTCILNMKKGYHGTTIYMNY